jgi:hypothetical protein
MKLKAIREFYDSEPFRPFTIHLADGRSVEVPHREFLFIHPREETIIVALPEGGFRMLSSDLVTEIDVRKLDRAKS